MAPVHIHIEQREHGDLNHEIQPWNAYQTGCIERDCPHIEGQDVSIFHQRATSFEQLEPHFVNGMPVADAFHLPVVAEEALKRRCAHLLPTAVIGVVAMEEAPHHIVSRQLLTDGALLFITVKLTPLGSFQEKEVYLTLVVCKAALRRVAQDACHESQYPYPPPPFHFGSGDELGHQAQAKGCIDAEKPHVAR